ncbi:MAG: PD40 domain-containing protein [Chloroflexi bacterium]|nr:PD40 domain-containing protein [Chloroflexota bacterium]
MDGDTGRISRRRALVGLLAATTATFGAACDLLSSSPAPPTASPSASPSPSPSGPGAGQPVATSVQIVAGASPAGPSALAAAFPAAASPAGAAQPGLPPIVPGRLPSPVASPGTVGSPSVVGSPGPPPGSSPVPGQIVSAVASPQPLPIALGRPGLLAVEAGGRILLVDPEKQQPTRALVASPDSSEPLWMPDGRSLVYVGGLGPAAELRLIGAAGGSLRRLTANARPEHGAAWSPRGALLAYALPSALGADSQPDPSAPEEVWLLDVSTGQDRKLADGFDPCWSPDGQWIAYATNGQRDGRGPRDNAIRVVSVDATDDRPLLAVSDLPPDLLPAFTIPFRPQTLRLRAPAWSPTGLQLVASADGHTSLVWTFDVRGQNLRPWAVAYEGGVGRARWSPDGARLAIESQPATGVAVVTVAEIASRREATIGGPEQGFQALGPAWAPDAARLAVVATILPSRRTEQRRATLHLYAADATPLGDLLTEPELRTPAWGAAP